VAKLSFKEFIVAAISAVAIFYLSIFCYSVYLTITEPSNYEHEPPVKYNEFKVQLVLIEVEKIEEVRDMYRFMFNEEPVDNLLGFSTFHKRSDGITSCLIVVAYPLANDENHLGLLMIQGHELEHCLRGRWHEPDNTPKPITFSGT